MRLTLVNTLPSAVSYLGRPELRKLYPRRSRGAKGKMAGRTEWTDGPDGQNGRMDGIKENLEEEE